MQNAPIHKAHEACIDTKTIEITPQMVEAGVEELRGKNIGSDLSDIVRGIYLMMEIERITRFFAQEEQCNFSVARPNVTSQRVARP